MYVTLAGFDHQVRVIWLTGSKLFLNYFSLQSSKYERTC